MAENTHESARTLVVYEVYVRNHGKFGTFADVEADLGRIRSLGADVLWFMPMHPIGRVRRKGSLGSPYAVADFRGVNPEYGTREDLRRLIEKAHGLGLKVLIDVVFNHAAHDSDLLRDHPVYFNRDSSGVPVATVPEWTDIIDLKHGHPGCTAYLVETLEEWARFGVDGFRCDVASLIPLAFWTEARKAVDKVKPGMIWLAESVHPAFIRKRRGQCLPGLSDAELYDAFDLAYDYDLWPLQQAAMAGALPASRYIEMLPFQEAMLPAHAVKLRFTENHDQARTAAVCQTPAQARAWTAFTAFNRGAFLIYAGQESGTEHTPSLFERDPVDWGGRALESFLTRLAALKKDPAQASGRFVLLAAEPAVQAAWDHPGAGLFGVFNTASGCGAVSVPLPDGVYPDLLNKGEARVRAGRLELPEAAAVLRVADAPVYEPLKSTVMDFSVPLR